MKRLINILLVSAVFLTLAGCDDFLTRVPRDKPNSQGYWQTENGVGLWMNGIYGGLTSLSGDLRWYGEGRSDNLYPTIYGDGPAFQMNAITASMGRSDWTKFYTVIARCNIALDNIPGMTSISEVKKEQFYAECYGIRALMYFYIVRLWGGCPLLLEPWDFEYSTQYKERSSVEAVALAIGDDIAKSVEYFEDSGSRQTSAYYFNKAVAYTLQMDYLAWRGEWAEVVKVYNTFKEAYPSKALITPGADFTATANKWKESLTDPTAGTSNEAIFSLVHNTTNAGTATYSPYAESVGYRSGSNASFALGRNPFLIMVQDLDDVRLGGAIDYPQKTAANLVPANAPVYGGGQGGVNDGVQQPKKFVANTGFMAFASPAEVFFPAPIYRYADVLLLYAEALNRTDVANGQKVIDIINSFRSSRGSKKVFSLADYPQQLGNRVTSREKLVMDERQLEFYGEPKRWFDLLRLDWGFEVVNAHISYLQIQSGQPPIGFGDKGRMLLPIAQKNLTNNPKLVQNTGY